VLREKLEIVLLRSPSAPTSV